MCPKGLIGARKPPERGKRRGFLSMERPLAHTRSKSSDFDHKRYGAPRATLPITSGFPRRRNGCILMAPPSSTG